MSTKNKKSPTMQFIVSDDVNPKIQLKPGMKFNVQTFELVDPTLKPIKKGAARLCGGSGTCLALINIED